MRLRLTNDVTSQALAFVDLSFPTDKMQITLLEDRKQLPGVHALFNKLPYTGKPSIYGKPS